MSLAAFALTTTFGLGVLFGDEITGRVSGANETIVNSGVNMGSVNAPAGGASSNTYAPIVSRVAPAVITIRSEGRAHPASQP